MKIKRSMAAHTTREFLRLGDVSAIRGVFPDFEKDATYHNSADLEISDGSNTATFCFDVDDESARAESLRRLDTMLRTLNQLRTRIASIRYAEDD